MSGGIEMGESARTDSRRETPRPTPASPPTPTPAPTPTPYASGAPPGGSRIHVRHGAQSLHIRIPAECTLAVLLWAIVTLLMVPCTGVLLFEALELADLEATVLPALLLLPMAYCGWRAVCALRSGERLDVAPEGLVYRRRLGSRRRRVALALDAIRSITANTTLIYCSAGGPFDRQPVRWTLNITIRYRRTPPEPEGLLVIARGATPEELEWLAGELRTWVRRLQRIGNSQDESAFWFEKAGAAR